MKKILAIIFYGWVFFILGSALSLLFKNLSPIDVQWGVLASAVAGVFILFFKE